MATLFRSVALVALVLLALTLFANKIIDTDIWWHLRAGKYIVETRTIPATDMFSYTSGGNKWVDLHWLFQVILYGTYSALGSYGISLLFMAVFAAAFAISLLTCRHTKSSIAVALFFGLALLACGARYLPRPEAFTYLMISLYMLLLHGFEQGRARRWVFALIPLQIIWTNMQGLFILGPFLIFAYAAHAVAAKAVPAPFRRDAFPEQTQKMVTLTAVFLGSIAACMVNPYGLQGLLFPFTLFTRAGGIDNVFASSIAELQPPFSGYNLTTPLKYFGAFTVLCAIAFGLDFKRLKLSHIIIFAGTVYLALNARRNVPVFVFAVLPLAVEHTGSLLNRLSEARNGRYRGLLGKAAVACYVLIFVTVLFQVYAVISNEYYAADKRAERLGFGFKEQTFPHGAFMFIKDKKVGGPFFNNLDIGGMFIWELYPQERVFIDPRLEVNSAKIFSEYQRATSSIESFEALSRKYGFNAAIISHTSQDALFLMPIMASSPKWALVYLDPIAAVFARVTAENEQIIKENRIDISRDKIPLLAENDTLNDSSPRLLTNLLGNVTTIAPSDIEAQNQFNLGLVFLVMGEYERAMKHLTRGLELIPSSIEGNYNLALAYDRMGLNESAIHFYKRTVKLDPHHALAHTNLGKIYDEMGLKNAAEKEYIRAIDCDGSRPIPLYNLGALYYERGDRNAARTYWERALKVDPSFAPASEGLRQLN